ncbi:hypothetical protein HYS54_02350 [Candidatus Micrarchaeota archaeon]|nr:hypothetical protein [Candidatus Micrarchaeota archaeon]
MRPTKDPAYRLLNDPEYRIENAINGLYQGLNWSPAVEREAKLAAVKERINAKAIAAEIRHRRLRLSEHQLLTIVASIDFLTKQAPYSSQLFDAALSFARGKPPTTREPALMLEYGRDDILKRVDFAENCRV